MPKYVGSIDFEEDYLDWEYLDGGADEEMERINFEEFGIEEEDDQWLDEELDDYGEEW